MTAPVHTHNHPARRRLTAAVAGALIAAGAPVVPADAQELDYSGVIAYSSQEEAESIAFVNGMVLDLGSLRLSASLPLLYQNSLWSSTVSTTGTSGLRGRGTGRMERRDGAESMNREWKIGIGDPVVRGEVAIAVDSAERNLLGISASVKAPLADADADFGTGRWDFGVGASLTSTIDEWLLFGDVGYWVLGDPADAELLDPVTASIGVGWRLADDRLSIIGSLFGSTAVVEGDPYLLDAAAAGSYRITGMQSLGAYLSFGLTGPLPRFSAGLTCRIRLFGS